MSLRQFSKPCAAQNSRQNQLDYNVGLVATPGGHRTALPFKTR
jgi:hypothetical protein